MYSKGHKLSTIIEWCMHRLDTNSLTLKSILKVATVWHLICSSWQHCSEQQLPIWLLTTETGTSEQTYW